LAGVVHVRGIEKVDAAVERAADDAVDFALLELPDLGEDAARIAEGHGAETQLRDQQAGIAELLHAH